MNEFLTIDYVLSFPGMMIICWLFVQLTKNLFDSFITELRTKWIVLGVAMILMAVKNLLSLEANMTFATIVTLVLLWLINSLVVWLATLKGHEMFVEKNE